MKFIPANLQTDLIVLWLCAATALSTGILINQFRAQPLSLMYESKAERLEKSVQRLASLAAVSRKMKGELPETLSLKEFSQFVTSKRGIVLDARPEVFHRVSHVPGALSLPRDDFENAYTALKQKLESSHSQPIVVYCSGDSCEDSGLVRKSLMDLGYTQVAIYEGGWSEWVAAGKPGETTR